MAEKTSREWIRWVLLFLFFAALYGIPHRSPWFGLVLLSLILAGLFAVGSMLWVALRVRSAADALARTAPIRALHPREVDALTWLGQLERILWRMPRGNVIDLAQAVRDAGSRPVVRTLRGPYRVTVRGHYHDRHDYIGDTEVLMLPGADRCVRQDNAAEVLLCGNVAVVLALNAAWRIDQARSLLQ